MRTETSAEFSDGYIPTGRFQTVIAFQALLHHGTTLTQKIIEEVKVMRKFPDNIQTNYTYLPNSLTNAPTVVGIAIAESNVHPDHTRKDSSGKIYSFIQPIDRSSVP